MKTLDWRLSPFHIFTLSNVVVNNKHCQPGLPEQDQEAAGEEGGEGFHKTTLNQLAFTSYLTHHLIHYLTH